MAATNTPGTLSTPAWYAQAGAVVLTYDPIGEGERNRERKSVTRQHDVSVPPDEMGRSMAGLMIADVRQAVSYLAQRSDVDPGRIAAARPFSGRRGGNWV